MKLFTLRVSLILLCSLISLGANAAEDNDLADIFARSIQYHATYYVNDDLTHSVRYDLKTQIIQESAIQNFKSSQLSYSTSIEKLNIHEAYTLKPDGQRVNVPETNYQQNINSGRDNKGPVYSDRTSLTIVFPDVEVGDTLSYSYTITTREPMFPGHFSALDSFPTTYAYDDVKIVLDVPSDLKASYRIRNLEEHVDSAANRTTYTWRYTNPSPKKDTRENFSVWDMETHPGFIFSTFTDYQEIVEAYAERALPKAAVTPKIRSLAKFIIGDETNPKEKARLLYEWVAKNITYAGNCIGVGAVVPHDIDFILDNRMGDCKDQSTLLQALFSAEGINSTQALVNASSIYTLPDTPTVTAVNHVINYLPEWDIFVDATSETVPFGLIPFSIQDKPVLLVSGYEKGARTPASSGDTQNITSRINIDKEGNASGLVSIKLGGLNAAYSRSSFRYATPDGEKEWLKNIFSHSGYEGFGSITKDDPAPMKDKFNYDIEFNKPKYIPLYGLAAFVIRPVVPAQLSVANLLDVSRNDETHAIACSSASSEEHYVYSLPENIEIIAAPENALIEGADIYYKSTYEIDGNELRITRKLDDRTKGNICSAEYINAQKEIIQKVLWDINSQVVYKVSK